MSSLGSSYSSLFPKTIHQIQNGFLPWAASSLNSLLLIAVVVVVGKVWWYSSNFYIRQEKKRKQTKRQTETGKTTGVYSSSERGRRVYLCWPLAYRGGGAGDDGCSRFYFDVFLHLLLLLFLSERVCFFHLFDSIYFSSRREKGPAHGFIISFLPTPGDDDDDVWQQTPQ